jgi:hypothetical protein
MIAHDTPAAPDAGPNLLKISESAFCVGLREAGTRLHGGLRTFTCPGTEPAGPWPWRRPLRCGHRCRQFREIAQAKRSRSPQGPPPASRSSAGLIKSWQDVFDIGAVGEFDQTHFYVAGCCQITSSRQHAFQPRSIGGDQRRIAAAL